MILECSLEYRFILIEEHGLRTEQSALKCKFSAENLRYANVMALSLLKFRWGAKKRRCQMKTSSVEKRSRGVIGRTG